MTQQSAKRVRQTKGSLDLALTGAMTKEILSSLVCMCVCVSVFLPMLHTEYQNLHYSSKVRTFLEVSNGPYNLKGLFDG